MEEALRLSNQNVFESNDESIISIKRFCAMQNNKKLVNKVRGRSNFSTEYLL